MGGKGNFMLTKKVLLICGLFFLISCGEKSTKPTIDPILPIEMVWLGEVREGLVETTIILGIRVFSGVAENVPVPEVLVNFQIVSGEGKLSTESAYTDGTGLVILGLTLGDQEGEVVVKASHHSEEFVDVNIGNSEVSSRLTIFARKYSRSSPDQVISMLNQAGDEASTRTAVRAGLASAGFSLENASGTVITSAGEPITLGDDLVSMLAHLEREGMRQTLGEFYEAFRASGFFIRDAEGEDLSSETFVEGIRRAAEMALENPDDPTFNIVFLILSQDALFQNAADISENTELSPMQSALLLFALADAANPQVVSKLVVPLAKILVMSSSTSSLESDLGFSIGLAMIGGLATAGALYWGAPAILTLAAVGTLGYGGFMIGETLRDTMNDLLNVNYATVSVSSDGFTPVVEGVGEGFGNQEGIPLIADAGENQVVQVHQTIELDGSKSRDDESDSLSYIWAQVSGPTPLAIRDAISSTASVIPTQQGEYVFQLTVTNNQGASSIDTIMIAVIMDTAGQIEISGEFGN
jgi:hypothetical protein